MTTINGKEYTLSPTEFKQSPCQYSTLLVHDKLGYYDRLSSLITEINKQLNCKSIVFGATTHGGYIPINSANKHANFLFDTDVTNYTNITANLTHVINNNYYFVSDLSIINPTFLQSSILFVETYHSKYDDFITKYKPIVISNKPSLQEYFSYPLVNSPISVLVPNSINTLFTMKFATYIQNGLLYYDNLINLCIMVKNGGTEFVDMLQSNLPFIDRWTILDTGSTDNTIENIKRIMSCKHGALYQEPFINFGASRNRCLELAGTQCTYNIMLDDSYHLKGDIRAFLQSIRGDQFADSFSLYITQPDIAYASNRVFKSCKNLKYKYAIHEVIQEENNVNVIIPRETAFVDDVSSDKLSVRTASRKQQDLNMLQQEINENPMDPRAYYYMAQTYSGMTMYEKAYEWFLKRIHHSNPGFQQEKHEACLEAGRIAQFILKRPVSEYLQWYEMACKVDDQRPDALYFIGAHHITSTPPNIPLAFEYLLKGFNLGFPEHRQYCLKPSITYNHIPKLLTNCCYDMQEYAVGESVSALYLKHNTKDSEPDVYSTVESWNKIFKLLTYSEKTKPCDTVIVYPDRPICCVIAPSGLYKWSGSDILKNGMGGSESMIVEIVSHLQQRGTFHVIVFCNCLQEEIFNNVQYIPLEILNHTLHTNFIHTCIISRYSEYLPLIIKNNVENVYLMSHDTSFSGNVITLCRQFKGVFCLTPWHAHHVGTQYPALNSRIKIIGHGIDLQKIETDTTRKIPCKFIYSSLANRGLYELLLMWRKIIRWNPNATLHIYSDIETPFMLNTFGTLMSQIKDLLNLHIPNIFYHGFVNKQTLYESWKTADIWFYPTTFQETFCVTALEAAASKTLVITTNVGALKDTVSDRGILIDVNVITEEWMENAVATVIQTIENVELKEQLIMRNYEWAKLQSWETQTTVLERILLSNAFEYRNIYNWVDNVPNGIRDVFIETFDKHLKQVHNPRILEIGAQNGISFIAMLYEFPNSTGVAIDNWNSSIQLKRSFDTNIMKAGLNQRVTVIQRDTFDALNMLVQDEDSFDVIYFNHCNNQLYVELNIAWKMLKPKGILIIKHFSYTNSIDKLIQTNTNVTVLLREYQHTFIQK